MKADIETRFVDDGRQFVDFLRCYTVVCPACGSAANVAIVDRDAAVLFAPRRLTCVSCGHVREWHESSLKYPSPDQAIDWYFGLPYFFRASWAGNTLWVANLEHLEFLRAYVGAKHRTRERDAYGWKNKSAASRMPKWISEAKNRASVLKVLNGLQAKMNKPPNQSAQRNAGSRPSAIDSPASATPSAPAPRG